MSTEISAEVGVVGTNTREEARQIAEHLHAGLRKAVATLAASGEIDLYADSGVMNTYASESMEDGVTIEIELASRLPLAYLKAIAKKASEYATVSAMDEALTDWFEETFAATERVLGNFLNVLSNLDRKATKLFRL